jgi:large subunit ribosomal protein L30
MAKKLKITQVRGLSGHVQRQIRTVKALGLKRIRHSVIKADTPQVRGMAGAVPHLVSVEEI